MHLLPLTIIGLVVLGVSTATFMVARHSIKEATEEGAELAEKREQQRKLLEEEEQQQISERNRTKKIRQLLFEIEERLSQHPLDSMLVISAANLAYDVKDYAKAETYYRRFIDSIDNTNQAAQIDHAFVVFQQGRQDEGKELLGKVVREHPRNQTALYNLAFLLVESGQRDSAMVVLKRCLDVNPTSPTGVSAAQILDQMLKQDTPATQ